MTFWCNATAGERIASPFEMVFAAKPKMSGVTGELREVNRDWSEPQAREKNDTRANLDKNPFVVGDEVYLKHSTRCDQPCSGPHRVTSIMSSVGVGLDGEDIPRHVSHLRRVPAVREQPESAAMDDDDTDGADDVAEIEHPKEWGPEKSDATSPPVAAVRDRRPPKWMADFYVVAIHCFP